MPDEQDTRIQIAEIKKDVEYIKEAVDKGFTEIPDKYVTRAEFEPVRNLVYGMTGLILTSALIAILAQVIK